MEINLSLDPEQAILNEKTINAEQRTLLDVEIRELYNKIRALEKTQTELKTINYDLDTKLFDVRRQRKEQERIAELKRQEELQQNRGR